ncbi:hypothetical protein GUITHDRAFT_77317, partial [Guillardia theta CCMP2712]
MQLERQEDRFQLLVKLGSGGQGEVYKAYDKVLKKNVAVKVTPKRHPGMKDEEWQERAVRSLRSEARLMERIGSHKSLIAIEGMCETEDAWFTVMTLADGGALFDHVVRHGELSEALASDYMLQITSAILHLHRRKFVHGDVKPENILLCSSDPTSNVKLCDFGMAREEGGEFEVEVDRGTFDFWAPEIIKRKPCSSSIDMWALGVVLFIMLCGSHPFDPTASCSDSEILSNICEGRLDRSNDVWPLLSLSCKSFIEALLHPDPEKRMSAEEALQHPWM